MKRLLAFALAAQACTAGNHGPDRDIQLLTDSLGVSHVYASSDRDAMFGAGYAMARDRLFQMELNRRRARGTLAAVLGPNSVKDDMGARVIGFARLGAADAARMQKEHPEDWALIAAWCDGVDWRIDEVRRGAAPRPYGLGRDELDFVPEAWTVQDAFAVAKTLAFGLSNSLDAEILASVLRNLAPDVANTLPLPMPAFDTSILASAGAAPPGARSTIPGRSPSSAAVPWPVTLPDDFRYTPVALDNGSNNWAVDGTHTDNGRPLLCGDPHQPLSSPQRLWPVHMSSVAGGGTLDVIGFAFAGTPTVELGHNAHVAWTATTNFADVMDLWDVSTDAHHAMLGGGPHPIEHRDEVISVAGMPDVVLGVDEVPGFGVILPEDMLPVPKYVLAHDQVLFNWTGFSATTEAFAFLGLDRARDLDDFERAVDHIEVGALNFVAADATGIDYRSHALVPDRGDPSTHEMPWHILPGDDAASLWTRGNLSGDKLPKLRAPASGLLFSANNDPWGFTADGDVQNDPFYYGTFYAQGFRAHRIEERLHALVDGGARIGRADLEALQGDVHSSLADSLLPVLDDAIAALASDPSLAPWASRSDLKELAARLHGWDRRMAADSGEALAFFGLQWFAARRAFGPSLPATLFQSIAAKSPPFFLGALRNVLEHRFAGADHFTPDGVRALLMGALDDTAAWLTERYPQGGVLSDVLQAGFHNPYGGALDAGNTPIGGNSDTLMVAEAPFFDGDHAATKASASEVSLYRMAVAFDDDGVPNATVDFALGAREDPDDPHARDQQAAWAAGLHAPLAFRREDVEAAATERLLLRAAH